MKIENYKLKIASRGFSLVEVIFSAAIFAIIAVSVYSGYANLTRLISASRDKVIGADLLNEQFEIVRNLPYQNIGLLQGIPSGVLSATSTITRDGRSFFVTRTVRNIDNPFDGTLGGNPNDLSPADYKLVEVSIVCDSCRNFSEMNASSYFAPKNLETASTNGALFIRVFDANGIPVPQAEIEITNSSAGIYIEETTDNNGSLQIVDAPPGINAYRIIASKPGYTTDRTYPASVSNPNPVKPDATVLLQQVTQISFIIDKVSTINVFSKNLQCGIVGNTPFNIAGAKLIGTNPNVIKYSGSFSTDAAGQKTLNNIEWDTFVLTPGGTENLIGINPASPFSVLPDSVQNVDMIFGAGAPNNLLVTVKDGATGLPLSEVQLTLTQGSFVANQVTGRGYMEQTDWSGGAGQTNYTNDTMYYSDDGNIDTLSPDGELKLKKILGDYALSGSLTSSIFDTGTSSNFTNIVWSPTDQPPQTGSNSVRFQIATSPDNTATTTWQYFGPDGTSSTFFDVSNNNINPIHNGHRYFRYKIFLSTLATNKTPNIASVAATYTSDCIPSGQSLFSTLSHGNHRLLLQKTGYQTQEFDVNIITNDEWQSVDANMLPE